MESICNFDEETSSSMAKEEMKINETGLKFIRWFLLEHKAKVNIIDVLQFYLAVEAGMQIWSHMHHQSWFLMKNQVLQMIQV